MSDVAQLNKVAELLTDVEQQPRRFSQYSEYRDSGISWLGDIPSHWQVRRLKFISDIQNSNVDKKAKEGEIPVRLCNYVDVYHREYIRSDIDFMRASASKEEIRKFLLRRGDVLITKDSEAWNDIAVPALVDDDFDDVLCGYHLAQVRPNEEWADGEFLLRAFVAHPVRDQFRVRANGITRFGLPADGIASAFFPVPPLEEQRVIAAFLRRETAKVDSLVAKKRRLIELLGEKRTALISHAVTKGLNPDAPTKPSGSDWLGDVPAHWKFKKLGFLVSMRGGMTPSKSNDNYWRGEIPWVSPKDMKCREIVDTEDHISASALEETALTLFQPPVVLMVVRGMILAHTFPVAITKVPVTVNQDMKSLTPRKECSEAYLLNLLNGLSRVILGTVDDSAHGTKVLRLPVWKHVGVFVPDEAEQVRICEHIDQILVRFDGLIKRVDAAIDRLNEYRSALVCAAVTGQIDVRKEAGDA